MLKKLLALLEPSKKEQLHYAFEQGFSQYVEIGDKFVGVNLPDLPNLEITESKGQWSCGKLKK